jgi:hypothetical protein
VTTLLAFWLAVLHIPGGAMGIRQGAVPGRLALMEAGAADNTLTSPNRGVDVVETSLCDGRYPWYDAATGRVRPIWPASTDVPQEWTNRLAALARRMGQAIDAIQKRIARFFRPLKLDRLPVPRRLGEFLMAALLFAGLAALVIFFLRVGLRGRAPSDVRAPEPSEARMISGLFDLPHEAELKDGALWNEAVRRRAHGDLAGALVCLFGYELLSLSRAGLIRLGPGRTGRQYVRALEDPHLRGPASATLRLFEEVYYGHRKPSAAAFEHVWKQAEAFRARLPGALP